MGEFSLFHRQDILMKLNKISWNLLKARWKLTAKNLWVILQLLYFKSCNRGKKLELLTRNPLTSKSEWSHFLPSLLMSSKINIWSMKSTYITWPGHDHVWIVRFLGGFTLPSSTAICCLRHTRRKPNWKTQIWVEDFVFKKQSLQACKIPHFLIK